MGKGIFFNVPEHGHVNPTLPLVAQLVQRGEVMQYYNEPRYREVIERTGAHFRPYRIRAFERCAASHGDLPKMAHMLADASREFIETHLEQIIAEKPDYIIHDSFCPWGKFVAEYLNVPAINVTVTFVFNNQTMLRMPRLAIQFALMMLFRRWNSVVGYLRSAAEIRIRHGIAISGPTSIFTNREQLNLVFTSRHLQPNGNKLGREFVFTGPSISPRSDAADFPFQKIRGGRRPLIYVSLGTIFNKNPQFFRNCIDAFSETDNQVIIALGGGLARETVGPAPKNILISDYVPQLEILKDADLFISHGGLGSVNESLYFGVPLLLFPQQSEQATNARRVQKLGAGICASTAGLTPGKLLDLSREILGNRQYYENARSVGSTLLASGGYLKAAKAILKHIYWGPSAEVQSNNGKRASPGAGYRQYSKSLLSNSRNSA